MAQNIAERRAEAKLETVSLISTDVRQMLSGTGWNPRTKDNVGPIETGGTLGAKAKAQAEVWQATPACLGRTLGVQH